MLVFQNQWLCLPLTHSLFSKLLPRTKHAATMLSPRLCPVWCHSVARATTLPTSPGSSFSLVFLLSWYPFPPFISVIGLIFSGQPNGFSFFFSEFNFYALLLWKIFCVFSVTFKTVIVKANKFTYMLVCDWIGWQYNYFLTLSMYILFILF